jgi:hypothetical protein
MIAWEQQSKQQSNREQTDQRQIVRGQTKPGYAWLAWDSLLLFLICTADMCSTLYWVHVGAASEANPWMAFCLHHGDAAFCAAKMVSFLPLLAFAAYYRPRRPRLIAISLRGTVALYVCIYLLAVGGQWL